MGTSALTTTSIFWPLDLAQRSGFCYGWKDPSICVAGLLDAESEDEAARMLASACTASAWLALKDACNGNPIILGYAHYYPKDQGLVIQSWKIQPTIIFFHRHPLSSLRFYALDASTFAALPTQDNNNFPSNAYAQLERHDLTQPSRALLSSALNQTTLNQFNASKLLETAVSDSNARLLPVTAAVLFSVSAAITVFSRPLRTLSRLVHFLSNLPVFPSINLKDACAVIQQIEVRAEQAEYFVTEIPHLRNRNESDITNYAARYTQFFNTIWMILNDLTIGIAFGAFLADNAEIISILINQYIKHYLIENIAFTLKWLNSWPAGLKLNTELSQFYSQTFLGAVQLWGNGLEIGMVWTRDVVYGVGLMSTFGGVSFAISMVVDLVGMCTGHVFVCYYVSGVVYYWMLKTAGSLFNLFRGKRYNVLRNRVDSWEYEMDQLIFGTILFTLLAFLFPTVLVYYALFAILRFAILLILAMMEMVLTFVNHFPLFALMLSVKDSWRLPGGIYFRRRGVRRGRGSGIGGDDCLVIENESLPLSLLFFQYVELFKVLASHYNPLRLAWCLLKGEYLGSIPRYEMRYKRK